MTIWGMASVRKGYPHYYYIFYYEKKKASESDSC